MWPTPPIKTAYKHQRQLILQYIFPPLFRSLFVLYYFFPISFLCFYSPLLHAQLIPQTPPLRLFSLLPVCNPAVLVLSFFKSPFSFSPFLDNSPFRLVTRFYWCLACFTGLGTRLKMVTQAYAFVTRINMIPHRPCRIQHQHKLITPRLCRSRYQIKINMRYFIQNWIFLRILFCLPCCRLFGMIWYTERKKSTTPSKKRVWRVKSIQNSFQVWKICKTLTKKNKKHQPELIMAEVKTFVNTAIYYLCSFRRY